VPLLRLDAEELLLAVVPEEAVDEEEPLLTWVEGLADDLLEVVLPTEEEELLAEEEVEEPLLTCVEGVAFLEEDALLDEEPMLYVLPVDLLTAVPEVDLVEGAE